MKKLLVSFMGIVVALGLTVGVTVKTENKSAASISVMMAEGDIGG